MTKLSYPSDGIYKYCKDSINLCSSNLRQANLNCDFDVPSSFSYKNYLSNLSGNILKYSKKINDINSKLYYSNNNFENVDLELGDSSNKIEVSKIKERDRMII